MTISHHTVVEGLAAWLPARSSAVASMMTVCPGETSAMVAINRIRILQSCNRLLEDDAGLILDQHLDPRDLKIVGRLDAKSPDRPIRLLCRRRAAVLIPAHCPLRQICSGAFVLAMGPFLHSSVVHSVNTDDYEGRPESLGSPKTKTAPLGSPARPEPKGAA